MERAHVLNALKRFKEEYQDIYGFTKLGIFGSYSRNTASDNSDVDVVIEIDKPDLFTWRY
jgi:uncharacterized protein